MKQIIKDTITGTIMLGMTIMALATFVIAIYKLAGK
tara:strand:- start:34 stop:141 length:108 start_codon:yes stop_codon:yes gene_type:complete